MTFNFKDYVKTLLNEAVDNRQILFETSYELTLQASVDHGDIFGSDDDEYSYEVLPNGIERNESGIVSVETQPYKNGKKTPRKFTVKKSNLDTNVKALFDAIVAHDNARLEPFVDNIAFGNNIFLIGFKSDNNISENDIEVTKLSKNNAEGLTVVIKKVESTVTSQIPATNEIENSDNSDFTLFDVESEKIGEDLYIYISLDETPSGHTFEWNEEADAIFLKLSNEEIASDDSIPASTVQGAPKVQTTTPNSPYVRIPIENDNFNRLYELYGNPENVETEPVYYLIKAEVTDESIPFYIGVETMREYQGAVKAYEDPQSGEMINTISTFVKKAITVNVLSTEAGNPVRNLYRAVVELSDVEGIGFEDNQAIKFRESTDTILVVPDLFDFEAADKQFENKIQNFKFGRENRYGQAAKPANYETTQEIKQNENIADLTNNFGPIKGDIDLDNFELGKVDIDKLLDLIHKPEVFHDTLYIFYVSTDKPVIKVSVLEYPNPFENPMDKKLVFKKIHKSYTATAFTQKVDEAKALKLNLVLTTLSGDNIVNKVERLTPKLKQEVEKAEKQVEEKPSGSVKSGDDYGYDKTENEITLNGVELVDKEFDPDSKEKSIMPVNVSAVNELLAIRLPINNEYAEYKVTAEAEETQINAKIRSISEDEDNLLIFINTDNDGGARALLFAASRLVPELSQIIKYNKQENAFLVTLPNSYLGTEFEKAYGEDDNFPEEFEIILGEGAKINFTKEES